jgi:DNA modification methylase
MGDGHSMNKLFYGDCLDILRNRDQNGNKYIKDESVDLIYLDPPFNSDRVYNVIFKEPNGRAAASQIKGFDDTWTWNDDVAREYEDIKEVGGKVADTMVGLEKILGYCNMFAYLVMMASRLVEMKRVLKPTGLLYLHCDHTAGHYIKILLDGIFGTNNFRNEIVWCYAGGGIPKKDFPRKHDTIFRYSKSSNYHYKPEMRDYKPQPKSLQRSSLISGGKGYKKEGTPVNDWWSDLPKLTSYKGEWLGYPTQKPEDLLERIVKTSSKPGDVVMDPFCGCGTTIDVADQLDRRWIGIDITHIAITVMKNRLGSDAEYEVIGEPVTPEDAEHLASDDPFQFQLWALGLVKARPEGGIKKGGDKGIDGKLLFEIPDRTETIIFSVKAGKVLPRDVRDLNGTVTANKAAVGVLITMLPPTREMREEAAKGGFYKPRGVLGEDTYPRIQIYTIEDLLKGEKVKYPRYLKDVTMPEVKRDVKEEDSGVDELKRWE